MSPSQLETYWRCPWQYWLRYGEGHKGKPGVALTEGKSHHSVFSDNNEYFIKKGENRSKQWLADRFAQHFDQDQKEIPRKHWVTSGTTKDKIIRRGVGIQRVYYDKVARYFAPELAEEKVKIIIGDITVLGILDVAGKLLHDGTQRLVKPRRGAWDYKIVGSAKPAREADDAVALTHYGLATSFILKGVDLTLRPPFVGFIQFLKGTNAKVVMQHSVVNISRVKWYRRQVISVANAISLGSFPMRSSCGWQCSRRFCGFYSRCRGKVWRA